jgi:HSP20 family molecular chaperone IbpA
MLRDLDLFDSGFIKQFQTELEAMFEEIRSGNVRGSWKIEQIDAPDAKGYVIQGHFRLDESLEPIEPLRPWRRRPMPEEPVDLPKTALKDVREPLVDVLEEDNALKIYAELPGEEKQDIQLNMKEDVVEIKSGGFYKKIDLPRRHVDVDGASSDYKNGVLTITIPKRTEPADRDPWKAKMV